MSGPWPKRQGIIAILPGRDRFKISGLADLAFPSSSIQDVPTAYAYELEAATIVQSSQVVEAVEKMCGARVAA